MIKLTLQLRWIIWLLFPLSAIFFQSCGTEHSVAAHTSTSSVIELKGWQYRTGNSPSNANGKPLFIRKSYEDTAWKPIDYPSAFDQYCRSDVWFRKTLPAWNSKNPTIFVRLVKDMMEVYLGDEKIYSSGDFSSKQKITFSGLDWHLFELPDGFAGKTLIIHVRADHPYPGIMGDVLLGSEKAIVGDLVKKNLVAAFLSILFLISGFISILILSVIKELDAYKGFVILQISMGIWTLVNSPILQFVVTAPRIMFYLFDISMFSAAIGFLLLAETIIAERYKLIFKRIRQFFIIFCTGSTVIVIALHPFNRYIAIPFYLSVLCAILIFIFLSLKSYRIVGHTEKFFLLALNTYTIFTLIELARYYIGVFQGSGPTNEYFLNIGGFCLFLFLTWAIVSQYVEMNKRIITSQERERVRIARDLHDEIGPRLTEIRMVTETAKQQSESGNSINEKLDELSSASDNVASTFGEIVWVLNPTNNTLEELGTYIGQCAVDFLRKADIRCRLELPPAFPEIEIPYEARRNIIMAVKETLNNVVRHAGATMVTVTLSMEREQLLITLRDDGHGFEMEGVSPFGHGLKNIRHRIESIGGTANIESVINSGTTIKMVVPV